jgi:hypothetical protein
MSLIIPEFDKKMPELSRINDNKTGRMVDFERFEEDLIPL